MARCLVCGEAAVRRLADFGPQPVCHHFHSGDREEDRHPLVLGQCGVCGVSQLIDPIASERLIPRVDWISYNEPEAHLDAMVDLLRGLPGISADSVVAGLSGKEDSTLRRFRERGITRTWRVDPRADLGIDNPRAGLESIEARVRPGWSARLRERYPAPDLFVVRHTLEHTRDVAGFLSALRELVAPGGHIVFEVPDCARGFRLLDYTVLWEDHSLYLVEATLPIVLRRHGFAIAGFQRYPAQYEDCLVAIARADDGEWRDSFAVEAEHDRVKAFSEGLNSRRLEWRRILTEWRVLGDVAIFGAGHQAAMFLNLLELGDLVRFVIDDHPSKRGLRMPGSRVPIVSSEEALRSGVTRWLSSVSAESEAKILARHKGLFDRGGAFASIFPVAAGECLRWIAGERAISPRRGTT